MTLINRNSPSPTDGLATVHEKYCTVQVTTPRRNRYDATYDYFRPPMLAGSCICRELAATRMEASQ